MELGREDERKCELVCVCDSSHSQKKCSQPQTYQILFILILDFKEIHCFNHTLNCHKNVLIDELYETFFIFVRISGAVDDSHLLYERALPRLSGACAIDDWVMEIERETLVSLEFI